jgi:hypothetical protein
MAILCCVAKKSSFRSTVTHEIFNFKVLKLENPYPAFLHNEQSR